MPTPAARRHPGLVFSDQDLIDVLQRHALNDRTLPRNHYASVRDDDEPSTHLFHLRFGSWNAALRAAGLSATPRAIQRAAVPPVWSEHAMIHCLRRCIADTGQSTIRGYDSWRRGLENPASVPNPQTIRARFGSWHTAAALACAAENASAPQTSGTRAA